MNGYSALLATSSFKIFSSEDVVLLRDMYPQITHSRPWITNSDLQSVVDTMQSGQISKGKLVKEFEQRICTFLGASSATAQGSGTSALILALKSLNIGAGDDVVIPTYVCRSVMDAVKIAGAEVVLCDVNENGVITAETVSPVITKKTKAIIAVHIFGHPCNILNLRQFEVPLIEDACQAFGLSINGRMAGTIGDLGILSFHGTKCLTTGEGGMMLINDIAWSQNRNVELTLESMNRSYSYSPLSDLQAALGLSQLARYSDFVDRRCRILKNYTEAASRLNIVIGTDPRSSLPFRFTLRIQNEFDSMQESFFKRGIAVRKGVDELLHRHHGMADLMFPIAVSLHKQTLSIPFYPGLSDDEVDYVKKSLEILKDAN